jgi:hypothetical protein
MEAIKNFFVRRLGLAPKSLHKNLHLTVYHARRFLEGVQNSEEPFRLSLKSSDLRFMVMAPGGENPRPELEPSQCDVGVRVVKSSEAISEIRALRSRFYEFETKKILSGRLPSNHMRNAFGARIFQPHITLLRPNSEIDRDLTKIGRAFRLEIETIIFDQFVIKCRIAEHKRRAS